MEVRRGSVVAETTCRGNLLTKNVDTEGGHRAWGTAAQGEGAPVTKKEHGAGVSSWICSIWKSSGLRWHSISSCQIRVSQKPLVVTVSRISDTPHSMQRARYTHTFISSASKMTAGRNIKTLLCLSEPGGTREEDVSKRETWTSF